jgi:hypothetical protein
MVQAITGRPADSPEKYPGDSNQEHNGHLQPSIAALSVASSFDTRSG